MSCLFFRTALIALLAVLSAGAFAQDPVAEMRARTEMLRSELERQRVESIEKLRLAIASLRDVLVRSCQFKSGTDCRLAELSSVQLILLDVEDAYRLTEARTFISTKRDAYKKIQETAREVRNKVDELVEQIERAEK